MLIVYGCVNMTPDLPNLLLGIRDLHPVQQATLLYGQILGYTQIYEEEKRQHEALNERIEPHLFSQESLDSWKRSLADNRNIYAHDLVRIDSDGTAIFCSLKRLHQRLGTETPKFEADDIGLMLVSLQAMKVEFLKTTCRVFRFGGTLLKSILPLLFDDTEYRLESDDYGRVHQLEFFFDVAPERDAALVLERLVNIKPRASSEQD